VVRLLEGDDGSFVVEAEKTKAGNIRWSFRRARQISSRASCARRSIA
jgi:hypothetical protein